MKRSFYNLKFKCKEEVNFGLDRSNLIVEKYPLTIDAYSE
jgi:hypothetical protein